MNNIYKRLAKLFYPILLLTVIIKIIPGKYKIAVYGLNYLGWITVFFVFLTFIIFLFLLFFEIKNKKFIKQRLLIFILAIILCKIASFYDAKRNEKLTKDDLIELFSD